jgi:hypothetical protein
MNIQSDFLTAFRDLFTQLFMKQSLIALLVVVFATHIISHVTKRYLEHRVSGVSTNHRGYPTLTDYRQILLSVAAIVASRRRSCQSDGLSESTA